MKRMVQICFVAFFISTMTACGSKDVKTEEQQETVQEELTEDIAEDETAIASKSPLVRENSTTIASADLDGTAEIENITGDEAIQLLSQIDVETLELESSFEDYQFICNGECLDIDGMTVYHIKAYLEETDEETKEETDSVVIGNEVQEADNVYFVTLDGNAMFKVDYTGENYINLETGEEIEIVQENIS